MDNFLERLKSKIQTKKSYIIDKNKDELNIKNLSKKINKDFPRQESKFNVIYSYSLKYGKFLYPGGKNKILYIGQSKGEKYNGKKDLGFRFKHCNGGNDNKINVCLSNYYQNGTILRLDIFSLKNEFESKTLEKQLRKEFLQEYKACPIADGASYRKEKA